LDSHEGEHDFDFNFGAWKTYITRLEHPLSGSHTWVEYDGISNVSKIWNGRASLFELEATGPAGLVEGVGLRLYNPKSHQWSLNWANSRDGIIGTPMVGGFSNGQGQFRDLEEFKGKFTWTAAVSPISSRTRAISNRHSLTMGERIGKQTGL